jgi:hypothetical protein
MPLLRESAAKPLCCQLCRIAFTRPKSPREGEMIEFLAQMPTDTMIFLTVAVLGLAVMLIVLRRLI